MFQLSPGSFRTRTKKVCRDPSSVPHQRERGPLHLKTTFINQVPIAAGVITRGSEIAFMRASTTCKHITSPPKWHPLKPQWIMAVAVSHGFDHGVQVTVLLTHIIHVYT